MKKIVIILAYIFPLIVSSCKSNGVSSFYCFPEDKCVTVLKQENNKVFIILGKYNSRSIPSKNYIKVSNMSFGYFSIILSKENNLLIHLEDKAVIEDKSLSESLQVYNNNKPLNDSLYTYYDGKYRRYKNDVEYISIDIKENYATDKTGKKIEQ